MITLLIVAYSIAVTALFFLGETMLASVLLIYGPLVTLVFLVFQLLKAMSALLALSAAVSRWVVVSSPARKEGVNSDTDWWDWMFREEGDRREEGD